MPTNSDDQRLLRDVFSHWIPTIIFALIGYLWFDSTQTLRATDARIVERIEDLTKTQQSLLVQVARLEERLTRSE